MATKYGLALAAPFVKGTAGSSFETLRRNHNKDNLIHVASSLGWLVRDTLGVDVFRACPNLVESSPSCGGGMERLAKAYKLNRLGPYKNGAINAAKISSEDFVLHMAKHGLNSYGEPLDDEDEAAAAVAALAASSQQQQQLHMQQQRQQQRQQDPEDSLLFSQDPGASLLDGAADCGGVSRGKVSAPSANDDHDPVVDVDEPHQVLDAGNVRAPAATDPLLAGGAVGRSADQSQVQAGSQVQGQAPADNRKKLCKTVWRGDVCTDWTCDRAHPPRCGDPMCYPRRRSTCQHWHRGSTGTQQQSSQRSLPHPQGQQQQRPRQQRHQPQQQQHQQGNGHGAAPGRAGRRQAQGFQGQSAHRRPEQQQQSRQHQRVRPRSRQGQRPPPAALPPPPLLSQHPGNWQQQQHRQVPSYRDVVANGPSSLLVSSSNNGSTGLAPSGRGPLGSVGFGLAQPDQALLNTVVASVLAVLGKGQHF